jgi:O-antigen ligase
MEELKPGPLIDKLLFLFFPMPLFMAPITTAGSSISGAIFLVLYLVSGYWRNWRVFFSRPWSFPLLFLILINILGMLWTTDLHRGFIVVSKLNYFLFSFAGATLPWSGRYFRWIVISFLTGLAVSFIIGFFQFFNVFPGLPMDPTLGPVGFANHIFLSLALTNALLWIVYDLKYRVVLSPFYNIGLGLAFFIHLILIGGRTGQVVFFLLFPLALMVLFPEKLKGLKTFGVIALCVIIFISSPLVRKRFSTGVNDFEYYKNGFATTSLGLRLVFWEGAFKMATEAPLFGIGTGDYGIKMVELQNRNAIPQTPGATHFDNPHNSYLAYLSGLGAVGLASLLWFLYAVFKEAWKKWQTPAGWFKLSYLGIFLLGSFMDTLIWGHDNAFSLGLICAIPVKEILQGDKQNWPFRQILNNQFRCLRNRLRMIADKLLLYAFPPEADIVSSLRRVGILRLDGLGDMVLFLDALKGYRKFFDESKFHITLIVEDWHQDLIKSCPDVNHIISINTRTFRKNLVYRHKKLSEIRAMGFDLFINGCIDRELGYGDTIVYASAASESYSFFAQPGQICEKEVGDAFYTHLVQDPKGTVHDLVRNAELVKAVGYSDFTVGRPGLDSFYSQKKEDYFIIAPGARFNANRWPLHHFIRLTEKLFYEFNLVPMIIGGKEERAMVQEIITSLPELPWIDQVGKLNLPGSASALAHGQFVICNDSGPMHLAMAVGAKTIAIVSGVGFRTYPEYPEHLRKDFLIIHDVKTDCFNCRGNCVYKKNQNEIKPCLENITVDRVYEGILKFIRTEPLSH